LRLLQTNHARATRPEKLLDRQEAPAGQACAYCGSPDYQVVVCLADGAAVRCAQCGLVRTFPYPSFHYDNTLHYIEGYVGREHVFAELARRFMSFIVRHAAGRELLEVGSGMGCLLEEARRRGFVARGLEINDVHVAAMRERGLTVYRGTLEQVNLPGGSIDAVCMSHVLEHVQDLRSLLTEVRRVLKPGGVFVTSQPHYAAPLPRLLGQRWLGWDWQRHVWHFDGPALANVLCAHGLAPLAVEYNSMYHPFLPAPFTWHVKPLVVQFGAGTLARVENLFGYGDQFFLAARRHDGDGH
jgi:SAM-dependent methyltransferase